MEVATIEATVKTATPIDFKVGDYVIFDYNNLTYTLYDVSPAKKQARSGTYGEAFTYDLKFKADTEQLAICPFLDLVPNDNHLTFTSLPSFSTYENVYGIAGRLQANMDYLYPGKWRFVVAQTDDAELQETLSEDKEFSISGESCLEGLKKIYESWGVSFIHTVEDGINVITLGTSAGKTSLFRYGKGQGLRTIKKNLQNSDQLCTRAYVFGSTRNLPARWYNNKGYIGEAQYAPNLMIPPSKWKDGKPQGAYIDAIFDGENRIEKYGLKIKTLSYDGSDSNKEEIYPSIEKLTAKVIRDAKAELEQTIYVPSPRYADNERMDMVLEGSSIADDGTENDPDYALWRDRQIKTIPQQGETFVTAEMVAETKYKQINVQKSVKLCSFEIAKPANYRLGEIVYENDYPYFKDVLDVVRFTKNDFESTLAATIYLQTPSGEHIKVRELAMTDKLEVSMQIPDSQHKLIELGTYNLMLNFSLNWNTDYVVPQIGEDVYLTYSIVENEVTLARGTKVLDDFFTIKIKQIGFDINDYTAASGAFKSIHFNSGLCSGRSFNIVQCSYLEEEDAWLLKCRRIVDSNVSQRYPNSISTISKDDQFVLLNINMPDLYVVTSMQRLYDTAIADLKHYSKPQYVIEPEIDNLQMARSPQVVKEGMYMPIEDADIDLNEDALIDSVTINNKGNQLRTFEVTLRNDKVYNRYNKLASRISELEDAVKNVQTAATVAPATEEKESEVVVPVSGEIDEKLTPISEKLEELSKMWSFDEENNAVRTPLNLIVDKNIAFNQRSREVVPDQEGGDSGSSLNVKTFGAVGDGKTDDTDAIQSAIDSAYYTSKKVHIPAGVYVITRALFVFDGTYIQGDGMNNTILKSAFGKNSVAKSYINRDKVSYNTVTNAGSMPVLDTENGHNRFYLGNGVVGYYDADRHTNPNHPLYWPNDGSTKWRTWNDERNNIEQKGEWVGRTGREGYSNGLILCSQNPELYHTDDKTSSSYDKTRPGGRIFTGVRNVSICDLQINTNSTDRSRDTAINFNYATNGIPSAIRETYDSSVLNIYLKGLYLFSIGGSGIRMTRAVDTTIHNCYIRQCSQYGIRMEGVTSINITGCYANGCMEGGYVLKGCNYSAITASAADSCSIGYNLQNCSGVSLVSCGAEATRYQKAEEIGEEDLYKGRAYCVKDSRGISLMSCYAMTSHPKVYSDDIIDMTDDEIDPNWLKSRHVLVMQSQDVQICYFHFKSFERVRSAPFRNANGDKVNYEGGLYNDKEAGSRYWQIQNYMVGAQFEIRGGDESSVRIISAEDKDTLAKTSEDRCNNLDILDPGTVPNPLLNEGYDTAGKTLSGDDGNGGWTITSADGEVARVEFENFEFLFPANATKTHGERSKFWAWRSSLILLRRNTDKTLESYSNHYGYIDILGQGKVSEGVDWAAAMADADTFKTYVIDIVKDYSKTSFIDGDKSFFGYGRFAWHQLDAPVAFEPSIFTPIPALVRDRAEGTRVSINTNTLEGFPGVVNKASVSVIGNKRVEATEDMEAIVPGTVFAVMSQESTQDIGDKSIFYCTNISGNEFFSVYAAGKRLGVMGRRIISTDSNHYSDIKRLQEDGSATSAALANKINSLIDRLAAHGFIIEEPVSDEVVFSLQDVKANETSFSLTFEIKAEKALYDAGVAYSSSKTSPAYGDNRVSAVGPVSDVYTAEVPRSTSNPERYIRLFANTQQGGGNSTRLYSGSYKLNADGSFYEL